MPLDKFCDRCGQLRGIWEETWIHGLFGMRDARVWVPHDCPADEATEQHRRALGYEVPL